MKLSILDFGNVNIKHEDITDVYNALFENVEVCDQLGFKKYWLSEHYSNSYSWNKPDTILPLLLSTTENIDIGVAGILFKFREAYRTACDYNILTALFPGRVDLGLASGAPINAILIEIYMVKTYNDIEKCYTTLLEFYKKKT